MMEKLLIVDDDNDILDMVKTYFKDEYEIISAKDGEEGLKLLREQSYSIVLLDIMMPKIDGYSMLTKMREFTDTPVIFLTAKGEQLDKVKGFIKGCDDYVTKPFDFTELSFRIKAIIKRTSNNSSPVQNKKLLSIKDLEINLEEYTVKRSEEEIKLTPKEFEILKLLTANKGRIYSTKNIYELIWKDTFLGNDNSVLTHIRNLREKLGDQVKSSKYIKTVWGVGYKVEKD
ncbi:response regulator transcription factor [Clostridium manihotivorum]|uniref:Stage 0 sporulation protein A homolog n=1 Tax=Clostridium manihotivorum TaxID=2320868 RepID=A0A3R5X210_9CLOT|nr:response regulator transcription factor [Clostridium manihotivorum]QAA32495.1 DNA-binding response regulator [Clostridium manihotivorum]